MIELPENFDSVFRYIVVVSQRAEQLINGAKPRTESRFQKRTLEAKDDVDAGTVPWRVLSQEEIDAQRQAIVDQFRAEMSGEGLEAEGDAAIRDVLPTSGEEAAAEVLDDEGEDRDNELARLQRLLGMVGGAAPKADGDEEAPEVEEVSLEAEAESEAEADAKSDEEEED
jgi:DNA-directed RNA polymerase subunit K/omega